MTTKKKKYRFYYLKRDRNIFIRIKGDKIEYMRIDRRPIWLNEGLDMGWWKNVRNFYKRVTEQEMALMM